MTIPEKLLHSSESGRPIQYFPSHRAGRDVLRLTGLLVLLAGSGVLLYGLWQSWLIYTLMGPVRVLSTLIMPLVSGLGLMVSGGAALIASRPGRQKGILLCEQGLRILQGNKIQDWPWKNITEVYLQREQYWPKVLATDSILILRLVDLHGQQLKLDARWKGISTVSEIASEQVGKLLLERQRPAFAAGQTLDFGPLAIDIRQGIRVHQMLMGWGVISGLRLMDGYLEILPRTQKAAGHKTAVQEIPNLTVLLALAATRTQILYPAG